MACTHLGGFALAAPDTAFLDALDRHARRRGEGIPTLSILVGPPEQTLPLWVSWAHHHRLQVIVVEQGSPQEIVTTWATALAQERELTAAAEAYVTLQQAASGNPRELLFRNKTVHERRILLDSLPLPASTPGVWELCRLLLEAPSPHAPGVLPEALRALITRDASAALCALLTLLPTGQAPALRVREGPLAFEALRTVAALCSAAPALTAVCALSPDSFSECTRRAESRVVAMMREGRIALDASALSSPGSSAVVPTLVRLRQEGVPASLVTLYAEAAQAVTAAYGTRAEDRARSAAERFLFEQLRCHPVTAGLFELNGQLEVGSGERPLEVDLLCRELKLAVEIDGYFHFQDRDAYRRDRKKDVALQRAGYWVLRVLAEDVVSRLESFLTTLITLVNDRRKHASGRETMNGPHG